MVWLQRFAQWFLTSFEWILRIITWIIIIALVLFVLLLLLTLHADFLYEHFIRRLYEDFFTSGQSQELMLRVIQVLSH